MKNQAVHSKGIIKDLSQLRDEELLEKRICHLGLQIEGTVLEDCIHQLHKELENNKFVFRPQCYLADEWFVSTGGTIISIPFYLAHPRLKKIEEKMMLEVEGGDREWCMKLLRHETGHAVYYAYALHKKRKISSFFGKPSTETPKTYRPKPYSKNFVRHLDNWYAQCDPDEDFAETFAVWLTPDLDWKKYYSGWGALKKLEFMDELMHSIQGKAPLYICNAKYYAASKMKSKLSTYYRRKKKECEEEYPEFYDSDLNKMFSDNSAYLKNELARSFIGKNKKIIINKVDHWTGEKKYNIAKLLKNLMGRCGDLSLRLCNSERESIMDVTAYLTNMVTNHMLTGRFKRKV